MYARFIQVLIDPTDRLQYDMDTITESIAKKGINAAATNGDREQNLAMLAAATPQNVVYLATNAESITEIAAINSGLRMRETPDNKMKEIVVLWCGNKDEKPVVEGLPIVTLQKFKKVKPSLNWNGFKELATEKPKKGFFTGFWK